MTEQTPTAEAPQPPAPDVCTTCHIERCITCHACRCDRDQDDTCGAQDCPGTRVRHSGPHTKFCVLCLSGEHERVNEQPTEGIAVQEIEVNP